ncbi:PadR family transcriptional regulator [Dactylosporangium vinaceum]|uniref:Helix-turn-helix transcriptional regulator n=1 Tax=Dactylosporangium vinaceum TaxID=53362 RepID=A0ABV5MFP3_9ACTN|nr:PadR family transcriptional regulator [Dactylosporangium vinaceum]UAB98804.1 PadR family transcriptional regulator [Dactylosporangium vinaceum]
MEHAVPKADRDLVALTVLALLLTGPRHTYEMHRLIEKTHKTFVTGLPRSLYHATNRLVATGDITVAGTGRDPGRPERTVYALTEPGGQRLREWVARLMRIPDADSTLFTAALNYAGCLPPPVVVDALHERQAELERRVRAALGALGLPLPRILLLETEYEAARLAAEAAWVQGIAADIERGALQWPGSPLEIAGVEALLREEGS